MKPLKNKKIVIAGGGTAGWMAAAAMAKQLGQVVDIILVESDDIGTVAVGEATIPTIHTFHSLLGLNEQEFMKATSATYKLAISFENWGQQGDDYFHSFGLAGKDSFFADFHHFWLRGLREGHTADYSEYCYELQAAKAKKFIKSEQDPLNYAFHFDANAYAMYLRKYSELRGVKRIEGKICKVNTNKANGYISSLELENGEVVDGDMFIDCTGFKSLLIEDTLKTGYEDWSHWLPCDSAYAVQTKTTEDAAPYTRSIAHKAGWRWKIPLQHRNGNGLVYSSKYMSDDVAKALLLESVEEDMITEPRLIKFKTGRRLKAWNKNCVALGLSSGFIEPLESTSIHMIMTGIIRFIRLFPSGDINPVLVDEYNNQAKVETERIRDFIILHYHVTQRDDSEFWNYCRNMDIPDSLAQRINLFKKHGQTFQLNGDIFRVNSLTQVMLGQGIMPEQYNPIVNAMKDNELKEFLTGYRNKITQAVDKLPRHQEFINYYCQKPSS